MLIKSLPICFPYSICFLLSRQEVGRRRKRQICGIRQVSQTWLTFGVPRSHVSLGVTSSCWVQLLSARVWALYVDMLCFWVFALISPAINFPPVLLFLFTTPSHSSLINLFTGWITLSSHKPLKLYLKDLQGHHYKALHELVLFYVAEEGSTYSTPANLCSFTLLTFTECLPARGC